MLPCAHVGGGTWAEPIGYGTPTSLAHRVGFDAEARDVLHPWHDHEVGVPLIVAVPLEIPRDACERDEVVPAAGPLERLVPEPLVQWLTTILQTIN
jgi:hypothetical protein